MQAGPFPVTASGRRQAKPAPGFQPSCQGLRGECRVVQVAGDEGSADLVRAVAVDPYLHECIDTGLLDLVDGHGAGNPADARTRVRGGGVERHERAILRQVLLQFAWTCTPARKWRRPVGASQQYGFFMPERWGSPTIGGPTITAGGVIFIGASMDAKVRAYALATGEELWSDQAQAPAVANPAVYEYKGREYVAFVAGGNTILKDQVGDQIVVYALPED